MNLFRRSNKQSCLYAVCTGRCTNISEIPDEAFSGGMLGTGFATEPLDDGSFYCPADGKVESVAQTGHAYTIHTNDGLDVLVHIGVDTVQLHGEGFESQVKEGQHVKAGTPLAKADLAFIRTKGLDPITAVLVTDPEKIGNIDYRFGSVTGGKDAVMSFCIHTHK